jgi:hypothetical protein
MTAFGKSGHSGNEGEITSGEWLLLTQSGPLRTFSYTSEDSCFQASILFLRKKS